MERNYNKLVRDNIPEIIEESGRKPITKTLNDTDYIIELEVKLLEELYEYMSSKEIEELADIEEVILALVKAKKITPEHFTHIREEKKRLRGGFDKKVYLEKVISKDAIGKID